MIRLVALDATDRTSLAEFEELLGKSDFGGCFCAVWTHLDDTWEPRCADPDRPNLAHTLADVRDGRRPGFFVHSGDAVVGWTCAENKADFAFHCERAPGSTTGVDDTWVIGCIALAQEHRGGGVTEGVIRAVVEEARQAGAKRVEAFPADPWTEARSYRGALSTYLRVGFVKERVDNGVALLSYSL